MGFVEIKQEMVGSELVENPDSFFVWAKNKFQVVKETEEITAKAFAFRLLDYVGAPDNERVGNPDKIFGEIVSHAKTLGIEPWPNVVGLRLQASACLAEFLERE